MTLPIPSPNWFSTGRTSVITWSVNITFNGLYHWNVSPLSLPISPWYSYIGEENNSSGYLYIGRYISNAGFEDFPGNLDDTPNNNATFIAIQAINSDIYGYPGYSISAFCNMGWDFSGATAGVNTQNEFNAMWTTTLFTVTFPQDSYGNTIYPIDFNETFSFDLSISIPVEEYYVWGLPNAPATYFEAPTYNSDWTFTISSTGGGANSASFSASNINSANNPLNGMPTRNIDFYNAIGYLNMGSSYESQPGSPAQIYNATASSCNIGPLSGLSTYEDSTSLLPIGLITPSDYSFANGLTVNTNTILSSSTAVFDAGQIIQEAESDPISYFGQATLMVSGCAPTELDIHGNVFEDGAPLNNVPLEFPNSGQVGNLFTQLIGPAGYLFPNGQQNPVESTIPATVPGQIGFTDLNGHTSLQSTVGTWLQTISFQYTRNSVTINGAITRSMDYGHYNAYLVNKFAIGAPIIHGFGGWVNTNYEYNGQQVAADIYSSMFNPQLQFRTIRYPYFIFRHNPIISIDSLSNVSEWTPNSSNITVTAESGGIEISVGNVTGTAACLLYPTYSNSSAYRYLQITLTSSSNSPITLMLPGGNVDWKFWNLQVDAANTPTTFLIDMCMPSGAGSTNDPNVVNSTFFDLNSYPIVYGDTIYSGVSSLSSITFADLTSEATYLITSIELVREKEFWFSAFIPMIAEGYSTTIDEHVANYSPTALAFYDRFGVGIVDHKIGLELISIAGLVADSLVPIYFSEVGQNSALDTYNDLNINSWSISDGILNSFYPGYTDPQYMPAEFLFGGGILIEPTGGNCTPIRNIDLTYSTEVDVQMVSPSIVVYPGEGSPFYGSSTQGGTTTIYSATDVSGKTIGLNYSDSGAPTNLLNNKQVTIQLNIPTGLLQGSANPDVNGYFTTGNPFMPNTWPVLSFSNSLVTSNSLVAKILPGSISSLPSIPAGYPIANAVCRPPVPASLVVSTATDIADRFLIAVVDGAGRLILEAANMANEETNTIVQIQIIDSARNCQSPSLVETEGIIHVFYLKGSSSNIYIATSYDSGVTWTMTSITGSYSEVSVTEQMGRLVVAGFVAGSGSIPGVWWIIVGVEASNGSVTWSSAVNMNLATNFPSNPPSGAGEISARSDGILRFVFTDTNGIILLLHCYSLANDGTGTWN